MAITLLNIIPRSQLPAANTALYTANNCKTVIDKFTVTNTSAAAVAVSVNLVAAGGVVSNANKVVSSKTVAINETYTFPELVGQSLESGGFISAIATAGAALTVSASGREIT